MSKDMVKEVANTFKCANAAGQNSTCISNFQDERYGKYTRVFTNLGGGTNTGKNKKRCTVCGSMAS